MVLCFHSFGQEIFKMKKTVLKDDDGNYLLRVSAVTKKLAQKKGLKKCKETGNTGCYVHYSGKEPKY